MMYTMSRDPDNAIFVEMMFKITGNLMKFLTSYVWLFLGWFTAFHVVMGMCVNSSFYDVGSALSKTFSMFTGDLGFETDVGFVAFTNILVQGWFGVLVVILYIMFIWEMSVVLMNHLLGWPFVTFRN